MKKALIVSPYLDHLGGGERYMLSLASVLESLGHEVYFAWDNIQEIASLATMLGITLNAPKLDPRVKSLYFHGHAREMYLATRPYDLVIYLSDGSIPLLGARRNILHMQVPFHGVGGKSWQNKLKYRLINYVIVNSQFTKRVVDNEYGINSRVLYPPVAPIKINGQKENIILSVGRFEASLNTKHQDVLIKAFKLLSPSLPGWRLVLAGGSSSDDWIVQLKALASNLPIDFRTNVSHDELAELYQHAAIYWHAAGYGVNEVKNPELTEHFGISTVEAITAGCIPLVVPYGGQREILPDAHYHWETIDDLVAKTIALASSPTAPTLDASRYSLASFEQGLESLLG